MTGRGRGWTPSVFSAGAVNFTLGEGPQILILHSHGSEAYSPERRGPVPGERLLPHHRLHPQRGPGGGGDGPGLPGPRVPGGPRHQPVRLPRLQRGLRAVPGGGPGLAGQVPPPSGSSWTSTGTPWWGRTGPSTSWSPRRMRKKWPRSCWWWAATAAGPTTPAGPTTLPWPSASRRSSSPTM